MKFLSPLLILPFLALTSCTTPPPTENPPVQYIPIPELL